MPNTPNTLYMLSAPLSLGATLARKTVIGVGIPASDAPPDMR